MIGMEINIDWTFYFMLVCISHVLQMATTAKVKLIFQLHNRLFWKRGRKYAVQILLVTHASNYVGVRARRLYTIRNDKISYPHNDVITDVAK